MDSIHVYNNQIVKHGESAPVHKNSILYESYEHLQHLLGGGSGGGGGLESAVGFCPCIYASIFLLSFVTLLLLYGNSATFFSPVQSSLF